MSRRADAWDLVVVGGGPAGSTLAALVKRRNPGRRVLIVEREPFPRPRAGEALLPAIAPILEELGALPKIERAGFVPMAGAAHIWGRDRRPWQALFGNSGRSAPGDWRSRSHGWQVERGRYDQILLEHAEESGVEALRGVDAVAYEPAGPGRGRLCLSEGAGRRWVEAAFVADCSGRAGFLPRRLRLRVLHRRLPGFVVHGRYRCDPFENPLAGTAEASRLLIQAVQDGWLWFLPIAADEASVGFASKREAPRGAAGVGLAAFYEGRLRLSEPIWACVKNSSRLRDGDGRDLFASRGCAYVGRVAHGDGWVSAGDAACFSDPLLSTGVFMAHMTGYRAAYAVNTHWRTPEARHRRSLWADYDLFVRRLSGAFFQMALFWYGEERSGRAWSARARRLTGAPRRIEPELETFASSLPESSSSGPAEALLKAEARLAQEALRHSRGVPEEACPRPEPRPRVEDAWRPRLLRPYRLREAWRVEAGTGLLKPVLQAHFTRPKSRGFFALDPLLDVPKEASGILSQVRRGKSVGDIVGSLVGEGAAESRARHIVNNFLQDLAAGGLVA